MRIDRRSVRAAGSATHALLVLILFAGLVAVTVPCGAFCGESTEHADVAEADASSHCGRTAAAQDDASSTAPVDCCSDGCNACGIDRISVPGPTVAVQLVVPDHAPTLASIQWRAEQGARLVRIRARSPDDAPAYLLDVLSRTTTLLI